MARADAIQFGPRDGYVLARPFSSIAHQAHHARPGKDALALHHRLHMNCVCSDDYVRPVPRHHVRADCALIMLEYSIAVSLRACVCVLGFDCVTATCCDASNRSDSFAHSSDRRQSNRQPHLIPRTHVKRIRRSTSRRQPSRDQHLPRTREQEHR